MSMSPLNGVVLGAAAVVASPALWLTLVEGTLPLTDALLRYLLSVLICWAALNVVAMLAFPESTPTPARVPGTDSASAADSGVDSALNGTAGPSGAEQAGLASESHASV